MGVLFHDLGLLSGDEVVECSASDLIGEYLGHTNHRCRDRLEMGIGKVLVINDIHTLANRYDHRNIFQREALDELVSFVQKSLARMVVVLIGPSQGVNELFVYQSSLVAPFPTEFLFANLTAQESLAILDKRLRAAGVTCASIVSPGSGQKFRKALEIFAILPLLG